MTAPHLSADDLAGYVDRKLPDPDRMRVETHLASCAECRAEYRAVRGLIRPRGGRWRGVAAALVAAAAIALVVWTARPAGPAIPGPVREPAASVGSVAHLYEPAGEVRAVRQIAWAPVPDAISYRVVVFDTVGQAVTELETTDTIQAVPDTIRFEPGATYYWKVEAQTEWGRWTASPLTRFLVAPAR